MQVGAEHYKKLALEKAQPVSCNCQSYLQQIQMLSVEVRQLQSRVVNPDPVDPYLSGLLDPDQ